MMNDKEINEFTKSVIKEAGLETPSADFLKNVMSQVKVESVRSVEVVYKPLISKKGWVFIASIIVLGFFVAFNNGSSTSILSDLDLSYFNNLNFNVNLPELKFSKIFTFSFVFLAGMVLVQVYGIKHFYLKE